MDLLDQSRDFQRYAVFATEFHSQVEVLADQRKGEVPEVIALEDAWHVLFEESAARVASGQQAMQHVEIYTGPGSEDWCTESAKRGKGSEDKIGLETAIKRSMKATRLYIGYFGIRISARKAGGAYAVRGQGGGDHGCGLRHRAGDRAALRQGGARLFLGDVADEVGRRAAEEIEADGGQAEFVRTDVTSGDNVRSLIDGAVERYGKLDIVFNNASISMMKPIPDIRRRTSTG